MIYPLIQIFLMFLIPFIIIRHHQWVLTRIFGSIGMAYVSGILVSVLVFGLQSLGFELIPNEDIGQIGGFAAIAIAIPLLLFSANLKELRKLSKTVLLSFGSVIVSVVVVTSMVFFLYGKYLENGAAFSAMAIGVYTGGTPNLNALGSIFRLSADQIGVANFSDILIGAVFYIFLLVIAKPLFSLVLTKKHSERYLKQTSEVINPDEIHFRDITNKKPIVYSVLLAIAMVFLSALIGILIFILRGSQEGTLMDILVPSLLIGVTILGILASFHRRVREVKGSNIIGQYLILVFSFAIASAIDINQLSNALGQVLLLFGMITIGTMILHVIIAKFLNLDAECTIITLTAGLYGPAFIPAMTKQLKNDSLTVPGLLCGSLGYAIGTFLGLLLSLWYMS